MNIDQIMECQLKKVFPTERVHTSISSVAVLRDVVTRGKKNPLWLGLTTRVQTARTDAGLHRLALEQLVGFSRGSLTRIEEGHSKPAIDTVERIAMALGVSPGWLAYGDEGTEPFRQRRARSPVPMDPPTPDPGKREPSGAYLAVGERCKRARISRSLSIRGVAKAAGISAQSLLLTEAGETVPLVSTCEALAVALDVSPVWLAYGYGVGVEEG